MAKSLASAFLQFVDASPSPFHAVFTSSKMLMKEAGFVELQEGSSWNGLIKPNGKYFFTRNKSCLLAFVVGGGVSSAAVPGFSIVGAHTDSPCLKVKPRSKREKLGHLQVGVECYGGGLWHTWFDRDLSLAGRVLVKKTDGSFSHELVKIDRPILRIPTLAIHLDRSVNDSFTFNKEVQLTPILALAAEKELNKAADASTSLSSSSTTSFASENHHSLLLDILAKELGGISPDSIQDFELCLYDTQPAAIGGANKEFIHSARLDNLMMSFCGVEALLKSCESLSSDDSQIRVLALFDNEEVGSNTAHGADSNLLEVTLKRLAVLCSPDVKTINVPNDTLEYSLSIEHDIEQEEDDDWIKINHSTLAVQEGVFERAMTKSMLISADMAHALHPNYPEKHEDMHRPMMNKGVVVKENANQRYATTSITTNILRQVAARAKVPLQEFVVRNDSPCGSTIGPMLSSKLGLRTIDIGNPQWSMHSIRETCGTQDVDQAVLLLAEFFTSFGAVDSTMPKL